MALKDTLSSPLRAQISVWLIFLCFVLFPFKRSFELPILIMTISGIVLSYRLGKDLFRLPATKAFTLLAACIWIPMVLSLPDTYSFKDTGGAVLAFTRLYFSGLFVIWTLKDTERVTQMVKLMAWLTAFWVGDALFQAAVGHDVLGYAQIPSRLNGVFGERHWKLGVALPILAPFLILSVRHKLSLMILAVLCTGAVVLMAGSRGGWLSYAVVCAVLIFTEVQNRRISLWKTAAFTALVVLLGAVLAFENAGTRARLDQSLMLFSGNEEKADLATSGRLTLWKDAWAMIKAHPVNGVGVRAFSFAHPEFQPPGDLYIQNNHVDKETGRPTGAGYAHQLVLEVTSETGVIGLAGLGLFFFLLVRFWIQVSPEQKSLALPFALAALAFLFPFNTHSSFYSAQWAVMIWLVIAMLCAALALEERTQEGLSS
jgi:O-antigen ligase